MAMIPHIGSTHDDTARNIINSMIDVINNQVKNYENLSEEIKENAKILNDESRDLQSRIDAAIVVANKINDENEDVQHQINQLILESGTSDAELIQARIPQTEEVFGVLKERLDKRDNNLLSKDVNVLDFGAVRDGQNDDHNAIQSAIDYANNKGIKRVFIPSGLYYISESIVLNGCSLHGVQGNIFSDFNVGTTIKTNDDIVAIKQGSYSAKDIKFNVSDILVEGALIGYEFNYVINSTFSNLYARHCDTGFKLGDKTSVGSMFNHFNNLYTRDCRVGVHSESNEYFNNNVFNNGFIQGHEIAFYQEVTGGYGAVNNTFNNVEFRSSLGRGYVTKNTINTVFNQCYFECGGNAIRTLTYSTFTINDCVFGLFKKDNTNNDTSFIFTESGANVGVHGGIIYLTQENDDTAFYNTSNEATYQNIRVTRSIALNGNVNGFNRFLKPVNQILYTTDIVQEQYVITGTLSVPSTTTEIIDFKYNDDFSRIPSVVIAQMRGASNAVALMSYSITERTASGGKIAVYNGSSSAKSVSFVVYAKQL